MLSVLQAHIRSRDPLCSSSSSSCDTAPTPRFPGTPSGKDSWYLYFKEFQQIDKGTFDQEWKSHPKEKKVLGCGLSENRWSKFFNAGNTHYTYSGLKNTAHPVEDGSLVHKFLEITNRLMVPLPVEKEGDTPHPGEGPYNSVLRPALMRVNRPTYACKETY